VEGSRKKKQGAVLRVFVVLLIVGGIVFLYFRRNMQETVPEKEMVTPVRVVTPRRGRLAKEYTTSGYAEAEAVVTVLPKIAGTLDELRVSMGDTVKEGELIAVIDDKQHALTLKQAETGYSAAKSTFERTERMFNSNAVSTQEYDQVKARYNSAETQYELAQLNMTYTRIRAPIGGVVLQKHTSPGSNVAPQVPLVTIADVEDVTVKVSIPEEYYGLFTARKEELSPRVTVPALDSLVLAARIRAIAPYISPESASFTVVCALPPGTEQVRPGMWVNISFPLETREQIYYLPQEALVGGDTLWYVEPTQKSSHKIEFTPVFETSHYFQIHESYRDYTFIVEGQHFLRGGALVKIVQAQEPKQ